MYKPKNGLIGDRQPTSILKHPCHNQELECHNKVISEDQHQRQLKNSDSLICQRLQSRKSFKTKQEFFPVENRKLALAEMVQVLIINCNFCTSIKRIC